ncbi:fibrinogen-like protein 1 isoform X1 [Drosophila sulfurigaster albostrigata]|uniref:fibrinogen-like protein 1 isoform X1 n=1 Tax=Drosophila sulfurigaster albostrigata TaxID=89887 RepID=UPI002D21AEF2|nr:fibrinogen-like protein 1 isoform X1 [Drosophila sulfurigaster albostrigata]
MNIFNYTRILTILLIINQVKNSYSVYSKELDDQCSTYCYKVVKPLLENVNTDESMTEEYNELQHRIKLQAENIKNLNKLIKSKNKLSKSCERLNGNQQKLIDQYETQLTTLKSEISLKDLEIKDLKSENVKTKELQDEITASKQASSCFGNVTNIQTLRVPIIHTMTVPCESNLPEAGAGWTVIQRRKDGTVHFKQPWSEYKEGFGNLHGEFFLGLENIHVLTQSQPHELFVFLEDFFKETRYARYSNFVIGNEKEFYELKVLGNYSGTAFDSLRPHVNHKFSTPDKDFTSKKCAQDFKSGWWFNNDGCFRSNLNGWYVFSDIGKEVNSLQWRLWKHRPLKFAQMMIRPLE